MIHQNETFHRSRRTGVPARAARIGNTPRQGRERCSPAKVDRVCHRGCHQSCPRGCVARIAGLQQANVPASQPSPAHRTAPPLNGKKTVTLGFSSARQGRLLGQPRFTPYKRYRITVNVYSTTNNSRFLRFIRLRQSVFPADRPLSLRPARDKQGNMGARTRPTDHLPISAPQTKMR